MKYIDKVTLVKSLNTPSGVTQRYNCVFCGGHNTLGVTKSHGKISWHCFRASCGSRGKSDVSLTVSELRSKAPALPTKFTLPPHFTYVSNQDAINWLSRWNCNWAISKGYAEIRYDPRQHRIVFLVRDSEGEIVDAAGRALHYGVKPKWHRYNNSGTPLVIGKGDTCYLCEDAASACALSHFGAGIALLGTHLSDATIPLLRGFKKCVVCLDPDAKLKALAMQRRVSPFVPTSVVFLEEDPKAYSKDQLGKVLGEN